MDLLFKRYASPFPFLDGMIQTGRFCEFVHSFLEEVNGEKEEDTTWQFFLHKVFDVSYEEFKQGIKTNRDHQNMSAKTFKTTYEHSMNILQNFNPEKGGEA